jgi:hypothetical protein
MPQLGTLGAKLDLVVRQGMTLGMYRVSVIDTATKLPIDLTGAVVTGQVRKLLPVEGVNPDPNGDAYITDIDIVRAPASGLLAHQYLFGLTSAKTDALKPGLSVKDPLGQYQYDTQVQFVDTSVRPHLYGKLTCYREVTRP